MGALCTQDVGSGCDSRAVSAHDENGCDLDFSGVRDWFGDYLGEELSCAVRAPTEDRLDSSAFYFGGILSPATEGPAASEGRVWFALGDGLITLFDHDFVSARASYVADVGFHQLSLRFRGFALIVSAGPPPASQTPAR